MRAVKTLGQRGTLYVVFPDLWQAVARTRALGAFMASDPAYVKSERISAAGPTVRVAHSRRLRGTISVDGRRARQSRPGRLAPHVTATSGFA